MKYNRWWMLINYYDFMTIRLLLPFLCLECKGFNPKTSFPQHSVLDRNSSRNFSMFAFLVAVHAYSSESCISSVIVYFHYHWRSWDFLAAFQRFREWYFWIGISFPGGCGTYVLFYLVALGRRCVLFLINSRENFPPLSGGIYLNICYSLRSMYKVQRKVIFKRLDLLNL